MKIVNLHFRGLVFALESIIKKPFSHTLNIVIITLVITIVASILILTQNSEKWQKNNVNYPQIIAYINESATQNDILKIEANINKFIPTLVKNYQFISKEQGLAELKNDKSIQNGIDNIGVDANNPLPNVLTINTNTADIRQLQTITKKITTLNFVDNIQLDENYANKINDLINFIKKISSILQVIFVLLLALIIYNLIRLQILSKQDEIVVVRLIGASDSFIMRPLSYYAIIQILAGTIISYCFINWFINFLNSLFAKFSNLFGKGFYINPLNTSQFLQLSGILLILTIFTVFVAVKLILREDHAN